MEFTQLVKKGSACLFLVLLAHGLILGFTIPTTVLSVVLVSVVCLFEAQLVKSERMEVRKEVLKLIASQTALVVDLQTEYEKKLVLRTSEFEQQVIKLSEQKKLGDEQIQERVQTLQAQIGAMKMNNAIRKS
jgi:hypothetical protein